MKPVYVFNPDNDLALAYGGDNYTAPPFARQMQRDLDVLPAWFAPPHAIVLVHDERTKQWLKQTTHSWNLKIAAAIPRELTSLPACQYFPWGWSVPIRHRLFNAGAREVDLPTTAMLAELRQLSHRRSSIVIHRHLKDILKLDLSPVPIELSTLGAVMDFASENRDCYLKSPWSGSGRGIYHVTNAHDPCFKNWCRGILSRQGSILCEIGLNKTLDFAMEFQSSKGKVTFAGYSVFQSDFHNQYQTGIVDRQEVLEKELTAQYKHIDTIKRELINLFSTMVAPLYEGYFGVDMLFYADAGKVEINPCVELNLRPTMGIVTCALGEKIIQHGQTGKFKIEYNKEGFTPERKGNRIYLTPVFKDTRYRAVLDID